MKTSQLVFKFMALATLAQGCDLTDKGKGLNLENFQTMEVEFLSPQDKTPYGIEVSLKGFTSEKVTIEIPGKQSLILRGTVKQTIDLGDWYENHCRVKVLNPQGAKGELRIWVKFFVL